MTQRATAIPTQLTAGDTWEWERTLPDYSGADGWAVRYAIAGAEVLTWDPAWAVATGTLHVITIPASATLTLAQGGPYRFVELVTNGTIRRTLDSVERIVAPDPLSYGPGDAISRARKRLKTIQDFLDGHLEDGVQYQMIGTRQIQHIPLPELRQIEKDTKAEIARLAARAAGPLGRPIRYRFGAPR